MKRKTAPAPRPRLDLVITGAQVFDGSGRAPFRNDVGIAGDRIVAIGDLSAADAVRRIDAGGLGLWPGFIDCHSHADMTLVNPAHPALLEPLVRQGITTFVGGNCGVSMAPVTETGRADLFAFWDFFLGAPQDDIVRWNSFAEMLDTIDAQGLLLNAAVLAPHGILRINVTGDRNDTARPDEIDRLKGMLADCLEAGAIGMSTGLQYFPGLATETGELTELARVVHRYDGVFTSHLRSYNSDTIGRALDEVFSISRDAEVPVQISHLFCVPRTHPLLDRATNMALNAGAWLYKKHPFELPMDLVLKPHLDAIHRQIATGLPIGVDAMPTAAGFTHLIAFFPPWALAGGVSEVLARLRDPATRAEIRRSIENGDARWPHRGRDSWSMNLFKIMGWNSVHLMSVKTERNQHLLGRNLQEIGDSTGRHPFDAACDLLIEERGRVLVFETPTFPGDDFVEQSLKGAMQDPNISIATDTILLGFGLPSHLFYDCYPKFLGRYARDRGLLTMAEAIRRCTSLPAEQLRLRDRGRIRVGGFADLVLFEPGRIASRSTPNKPAAFPVGVHSVFVNGRPVVDPEGFHPEPRPGRLIRRGT